MIVEYIRYMLREPGLGSAETASAAFEAAYRIASSSLDISPHCIAYELSRCKEEQKRYILRIGWDSIEGHMGGFRRAPEFSPFLAAIKPFIDQIEEMQHYELTSVVASKRKVDAI